MARYIYRPTFLKGHRVEVALVTNLLINPWISLSIGWFMNNSTAMLSSCARGEGAGMHCNGMETVISLYWVSPLSPVCVTTSTQESTSRVLKSKFEVENFLWMLCLTVDTPKHSFTGLCRPKWSSGRLALSAGTTSCLSALNTQLHICLRLAHSP